MVRSTPTRANSSRASSGTKARSAARTSASSPASRSRCSGHGGSRRVSTTRRNPGTGVVIICSSAVCTSGPVIPWTSSSTSTTGAATWRRASATRSAMSVAAMSVAGPRSSATRRRRTSAGASTTAARDVATARQKARGASSAGPTVSHAGRGTARAASQALTSTVLPHPAEADRSVTGDSAPRSRRSYRRGRSTTCSATGTAYFTSEWSSPSGRAGRSSSSAGIVTPDLGMPLILRATVSFSGDDPAGTECRTQGNTSSRIQAAADSGECRHGSRR